MMLSQGGTGPLRSRKVRAPLTHQLTLTGFKREDLSPREGYLLNWSQRQQETVRKREGESCQEGPVGDLGERQESRGLMADFPKPGMESWRGLKTREQQG